MLAYLVLCYNFELIGSDLCQLTRLYSKHKLQYGQFPFHLSEIDLQQILIHAIFIKLVQIIGAGHVPVEVHITFL